MRDYPDFLTVAQHNSSGKGSSQYAELWTHSEEKACANSTLTTYTVSLPNDDYAYQIHAIYAIMNGIEMLTTRVYVGSDYIAINSALGGCLIELSHSNAVKRRYPNTYYIKCIQSSGATRNVRVSVLGSRVL